VSPQFWWYVARASGMVAAVLIALTLIWGLLLTTKLIERRGLPAWLTDLHRALGGLSVFFIAVHLVALWADSYEDFAWAELFVPFASAWKAGPVAWGIGAFWGLVVVEGTSLVQRRMPRKVWRGLHFLSYPVAVMVGLHAVTAGTDAGNPWFLAVTFLLMGLLTFLTVYRVMFVPDEVQSVFLLTILDIWGQELQTAGLMLIYGLLTRVPRVEL
jgi:DMSO/TMAO reductase YedYZ heme-binding membrane subunit